MSEIKNGSIGVTTENIFPVIKKFLYSDHEIFLRELVSNAVDATQKLKTLQAFGEFKGELTDMDVRVTVDADNGTLTISDHGIGMTAEDVDKYINQIAFSGAEEFLDKYKDSANSIIGHFGLGFYSAFMVSKKVEIRSLSYKEGAKAVQWTCDGSPEYQMEEIEKDRRGTDIILYIDDESKEFLQQSRIDALLKKYCRFLPVPVISGKIQEWKDGKYVDTDRDNVVNATEPLWTRKPSELTDKDYLEFYHELYPGQDDPMFWIHLNVDYPFTLTGILYFPKIKNNIEVTKNRIQLYSNQVFVTDSVEGVVPEFMMLLQGVLDSPDIPLNVSRSYLQSDSAVKKISGYITKKVAQRLESIFKDDRKEYEAKWDDIKIFITYGMLTDQKFADAAMKFYLVKDNEDKYFTLEEYRTLIEANQTDREGDVVYIYSTDPTAQNRYIDNAAKKGYSVMILNGELDSHLVSFLESKLEKSRFVRVDSDVTENLVPKADKKSAQLPAADLAIVTGLFQSQLPKSADANYMVVTEALGADAEPVEITQNEYMRRMKDMAALQPGMSFYGQMPDSYSLVVNTDSPVIKKIIDAATAKIGDEVKSTLATIDEGNKAIEKTRGEVKDNKPTDEQQAALTADEKKVADARDAQANTLKAFASEVPAVNQLIDLALLGNGLLKGQDLTRFIHRSMSML